MPKIDPWPQSPTRKQIEAVAKEEPSVFSVVLSASVVNCRKFGFNFEIRVRSHQLRLDEEAVGAVALD
jgi:hypothetical protein